MKKTLVALAALSAVSAFAQVTLSGRASMDVSTYQAVGSTGGAAFDLHNRVRVADSASRITFAANEDLGNGQKAGVYCETGLNIDNANIGGQGGVGSGATENSNTQTWCSREGRMYFGNANYEIRLGRQNVWWTQGELNQVGSTFLGADSSTNLQNGGVGVYTVRGENMIKLTAASGAFAGSEVYTAFMGASGATTYNTGGVAGSWSGKSTGQPTNASGEAAGAAAGAKGKYNGFKVQYTTGPFVAMWDYQNSQHAVLAAGTATSDFDRSANKFGLAYKYNPTSLVSAQYWAKKRTDNSGTAALTNVFGINPTSSASYASTNTAITGSAKDTGYAFVAKHDLGGGLTLHGQYTKANSIKDGSGTEVANTGATAYTLGLTKAFSKRTHVYGAYHLITNESAAAYNMTGGSYQSGTSNLGADVKMLALGMIHNF
jgi:predicted porin